MKNWRTNWNGILAVGALLLGAALFLPACLNDNASSTAPRSPIQGGGGAAGANSTPTPSSGNNSAVTGVAIYALLESSSNMVVVGVADSNGPVSTAGVTLTGAGIPAYPAPFLISGAQPVTTGSSTESVSFGGYETSGVTYITGAPYTITVAADGNSYSDSITAIGNALASGATPGGVTLSWSAGVTSSSSNPMDLSQVSVINSSGTTILNDPSPLQAPFLNSPVTLSASSLTNASDILLTCETVKLNAFPGSFPGSFFLTNEQLFDSY